MTPLCSQRNMECHIVVFWFCKNYCHLDPNKQVSKVIFRGNVDNVPHTPLVFIKKYFEMKLDSKLDLSIT